MWLRDPVDIEVTRSADLPIGMQFWDNYDNGPLDITGYTFSLLIAKVEGSDAFVDEEIEVTDPTNGNIDFIIKSNFFDNVSLTKQTSTFAYQIISKDVEGSKVIAARGAIIVRPGILESATSDDGNDDSWSQEDW